MPVTLSPAKWLAAIDTHYLTEFVKEGGSTVKFAVCYPSVVLAQVAGDLQQLGRSHGFLVAEVDAATTRVHMIDQVFARVADQLPWAELIDAFFRELAVAQHWQTPPQFSAESVAAQVARLNECSVEHVLKVFDKAIGQILVRREAVSGGDGDDRVGAPATATRLDEFLLNHRMAEEFRTALFWLLQVRRDSPRGDSVQWRRVLDWLCGRVRLISELKLEQIYTKINRTNARHILGSLLSFIRAAGYTGLIITIDGSRLLEETRVRDGSVNYTKAARIESYQVLREFIDSADELDALLLTVFVPHTFLDLDVGSRGIGQYYALRDRIYDDVRDRTLANPLNALARIAVPIEEVA